jgi:hypothetical protein
MTPGSRMPVQRSVMKPVAIPIAIAIAIIASIAAGVAPAIPSAGPPDFAREIRPIFEANCQRCHGAKVRKSDFRLDLKASALAGGLSGPAIVPGKSAESLLYR